MHLNVLTQGSPSPTFEWMWRHPEDRTATGYRSLDYWTQLARQLEAACIDALFFADVQGTYDVYRDSWSDAVRYGVQVPDIDPVLVIPAAAAVTRHLGFAVTYSTTYHPPYQCARVFSTLDHLTGGRIAWNVVTSYLRSAEANGLGEGLDHDQRYDRADEYVEVVEGLWNSWKPGAVVRDRESRAFADARQVAPIDHDGKFFRVRGPLNTLPPLQSKPVLCQAGGSPRGRQFAAEHADTLLASAFGVEKMKAYRNDIRTRMAAAGRNPDDCKVLFIVAPVLGETMREAQEKAELLSQATDDLAEAALGHLSALTENDFSIYDLDEPVPVLSTNGHRSTLADFFSLNEDNTKPLREHAAGWTINSLPLVGTPDHVAGLMADAMAEVGGDGYLIAGKPNRRYIHEIADGLCPALRRRGVIRDGYAHDYLRDNLMAF